ncbi:MAG: GNAT family N-acetyltransferase [Gammaproteobacteria bacterium]|nr:GNAT family N-acetyltransferase [Gammaproteobacteria bacterium]
MGANFLDEPMRIRRAKVDEAEAIRCLVLDAVRPHKGEDFSEEGWCTFKESNSLPRIVERLQSPDYLSFVCESDDKLVGIIIIKDDTKIDQLFVDPAFRRRGIAKALWNEARQICDSPSGTSEYWVNSSTIGVSMYESFGFLPAGSKQIKNGIIFFPMFLSVQSEVKK